ncbi:MAG: DUF4395 domain-containing protein [Bacteroidales bacterium]|nr:DUF4395 domain-containing protein [Bacteroidales bacterium]
MAHICPIEGTLINEPTVRVVAGLVAITATAGVYFQSPVVFLFLAFDFYVRGFDKKEWSLFRYFGIKTVSFIDIKEKLIDAGGKKFASKVGFILSSVIAVAAFLQLPIVIYSLGGILVLFATLEAVLAYCVGCKIYTLYNKFFLKR